MGGKYLGTPGYLFWASAGGWIKFVLTSHHTQKSILGGLSTLFERQHSIKVLEENMKEFSEKRFLNKKQKWLTLKEKIVNCVLLNFTWKDVLFKKTIAGVNT